MAIKSGAKIPKVNTKFDWFTSFLLNVKVRLQGACGSCPSSTMTLKMGIERKLKEMIPEISEVVQVL